MSDDWEAAAAEVWGDQRQAQLQAELNGSEREVRYLEDRLDKVQQENDELQELLAEAREELAQADDRIHELEQLVESFRDWS